MSVVSYKAYLENLQKHKSSLCRCLAEHDGLVRPRADDNQIHVAMPTDDVDPVASASSLLQGLDRLPPRVSCMEPSDTSFHRQLLRR